MQSMVHVHFDFEELQVDEYGYKIVMEIPGLYYWFEEAGDSKSSSLSEITVTLLLEILACFYFD